jgi:hypothetical protein
VLEGGRIYCPFFTSATFVLAPECLSVFICSTSLTTLPRPLQQIPSGIFIVAIVKKDMAKAARKKAAPKKTSTKKKTAVKKKAAPKKKSAGEKGSTKKNKLGVKNSLVNNINAKKKKGASKTKKKSTISKKAYEDMENNWGKEK